MTSVRRKSNIAPLSFVCVCVCFDIRLDKSLPK